MPVAIVLSGGFAHGSFEVGAVRYLYDHGIRPNILCGTSVGSVNAVKLAEGEGGPTTGLAGLEGIWLGLNRNSDVYIDGPLLIYLKTNQPLIYQAIPSFILVPDPDPVPGAIITATNVGTAMPSLFAEVLTAPGRALGFVAGGVIGALRPLIECSVICSIAESLLSVQLPMSFFDQSPLLDLLATQLNVHLVQQWIAAGGQLRFATVALESGKLRYVTETGTIVERDNSTAVTTLPSLSFEQTACQPLADNVAGILREIAALGQPPPPDDPQYPNWEAQYSAYEAQFQQAQQELTNCEQANPPTTIPDFRWGVNASLALPSFLVPQVFANEHYVDAGVRDVMPMAVAAQMGATEIYAVNDSSFVGQDSAPQNLIDVAFRALASIAIDEIAYRSATEVTNSENVKVSVIQCTFSGPNDSYTIHPAWIRINMSYGYMRAADTLNPVAVRPDRCYELADKITGFRRFIFQFEAAACNPAVAESQFNGPMLRWAKGILSLLITERSILGGAIPADVIGSWTNWEKHSWPLPSAAPFDTFYSVPAAPAAGYIPNGTLVKEAYTAPTVGQLPPIGPIYLILGGAKFPLTTNQIAELGLQQAPVESVPVITDANGNVVTSSISFLPDIPIEGTLIREEGAADFYVIQDGAKNLVTHPNGYLANHGLPPSAVLTVPVGSLAQIPNAIMLREGSGAIWVIFGHARFHIPNVATLSRLYSGLPIVQIFAGGLKNVATIPIDGTLLRDDNGAISVIFGGAQFHVPDPPTLNRLYPGVPTHQLWNSAFDYIPTIPVDGTLLREENGAIAVIFGGAQFHVPDPPTLNRLYPGVPTHQLWNGAFDYIPTIPVDGTLLQGENGPTAVIFGGAQFDIPDRDTLTRLYDRVPIHPLWNGAFGYIPAIPVDGTLLRDENGAIVVIFGGAQFLVPDVATLNRLYPGVTFDQLWNSAFDYIPKIPVDGTILQDENGPTAVIFGGAQFHIPDRDTLTRLYDRVPVHPLWNGAFGYIPAIPVDGTLLRDENGAIVVIFGGAQFHVPDVATLNLLFHGVPIDQLWTGAFAAVPLIPVEGTLLKEYTNPQIYVIQGGRKVAAATGAAGTVHTLWDGGLNQIPS